MALSNHLFQSSNIPELSLISHEILETFHTFVSILQDLEICTRVIQEKCGTWLISLVSDTVKVQIGLEGINISFQILQAKKLDFFLFYVIN